jgi:hypothetical protein
LGVSAIETTSSESESINSLSLIVFLALLFHKGTYGFIPSQYAQLMRALQLRHP